MNKFKKIIYIRGRKGGVVIVVVVVVGSDGAIYNLFVDFLGSFFGKLMTEEKEGEIRKKKKKKGEKRKRQTRHSKTRSLLEENNSNSGLIKHKYPYEIINIILYYL